MFRRVAKIVSMDDNELRQLYKYDDGMYWIDTHQCSNVFGWHIGGAHVQSISAIVQRENVRVGIFRGGDGAGLLMLCTDGVLRVVINTYFKYQFTMSPQPEHNFSSDSFNITAAPDTCTAFRNVCAVLTGSTRVVRVDRRYRAVCLLAAQIVQNYGVSERGNDEILEKSGVIVTDTCIINTLAPYWVDHRARASRAWKLGIATTTPAAAVAVAYADVCVVTHD